MNPTTTRYGVLFYPLGSYLVIQGSPTPFLGGLLFAYQTKLHDFSHNGILHIACFITLCECFLGVLSWEKHAKCPHWRTYSGTFATSGYEEEESIGKES